MGKKFVKFPKFAAQKGRKRSLARRSLGGLGGEQKASSSCARQEINLGQKNKGFPCTILDFGLWISPSKVSTLVSRIKSVLSRSNFMTD